MTYLTKLEWLDLNDNEFFGLPEEVFERSPNEIIQTILAWQQTNFVRQEEASEVIRPMPVEVRMLPVAV